MNLAQFIDPEWVRAGFPRRTLPARHPAALDPPPAQAAPVAAWPRREVDRSPVRAGLDENVPDVRPLGSPAPVKRRPVRNVDRASGLPLMDRICTALAELGEPMTIDEIAQMLGAKSSQVRACLANNAADVRAAGLGMPRRYVLSTAGQRRVAGPPGPAAAEEARGREGAAGLAGACAG